MNKNLDYEFDEHLKARGESLGPVISQYFKTLEKNGPRYGRFPIPTYYKPHLITSDQEHLLKRAALTLSSAVNVVTRLFFEERHVNAQFHLKPEERELLMMDPGYSRAVVFARFEGLLEGQSFKLLGFNSDVSAGSAYADLVEKLLLEEATLKPFFEENQIKSSLRVQGILEAILEAYEEFGGLEAPRIAIMDWRGARTQHEFELLKNYFESKGYKTIIVDPRELKYKSGKLYHKDFKIDVILRRAAFEEILERIDEVQDLIKACRDHAVCMVNSFRSWLATSQTMLSILTNPQFDHFFTENENRIKHECLPWTRSAADAEAFYGGKKLYLINLLKDEKENLVLKPQASYAGKGIVIGRDTRDAEWNEAIDKAIKENWTIQEFVNVPIMTVPEIVNKKLDFAYKRYNFNALVFGGKYAGGFTRLSQEIVINVAKAGGVIPAIAAEAVPERWTLNDQR